MSLVGIALSLFFATLFLKRYLFWLWLWQLKQYHVGRFKAYLETESGKRVLFVPYQRHWLRPRLTVKTIPLVVVGFVFILSILFTTVINDRALFLFLMWILAPIVASGFVLALQTLVIAWQRYLFKKAKIKRDEFPELKVIGVTGSYGKSGTKEFLAEMLSLKYRVLKTKRNLNSDVGIAQLVLDDLNSKTEVLVYEQGALGTGEIARMSEVLQPEIGVVTGINEQHLATFGSQDNIKEAKFELEVDVAILNWDSDKLREAVGDGLCSAEQRRCSTERRADLWADDIKLDKEGVSFVLRTKDDMIPIRLDLPGKHNVINFVLAASAAIELGLSLEEIGGAVERMTVPDSGLRIKKKGETTIIDDTYSANPEGVLSALEYLSLYEGPKALVMRCLIELGEVSDEVHERVGRRASEVCDLMIVTKPDCLCSIRDGFDGAILIEDSDEIIKKLEPFLSEGTILLESRVPNGVKDFLL